MTAEELCPYLGSMCMVRFGCRSCGGAHVLQGAPALGRYAGEVLLRGHTFNIENIEQVWRPTEPPRRRQDVGLRLLCAVLRGKRRGATSSLPDLG